MILISIREPRFPIRVIKKLLKGNGNLIINLPYTYNIPRLTIRLYNYLI